MNVNILKPCGYCSGVNNAINLAMKVRKDFLNQEYIYVLGMLVHNENVIKNLESLKIKCISNDEETVSKLPNGSIVIFTAHGHVKSLDILAEKKNFTAFDAVCPMVKANLSFIENNKAKTIIYIGYKNHPETEAALSYSDNIFLYDINEKLDFSRIKEDPIIINQTTLNVNELHSIHNEITKHFPNAKIMNEVCNATRLRQESIINIDQQVDTIIVVGDKKSSNTNRLVEIAKQYHSSALILQVKDSSEIDTEIIRNKKDIVIVSGASTPLNDINDVYNKIQSIK